MNGLIMIIFLIMKNHKSLMQVGGMGGGELLEILHDEKRFKTCRTCRKLFMDTGTFNKHEISHDEEKAQNLQDMLEIIQ